MICTCRRHFQVLRTNRLQGRCSLKTPAAQWNCLIMQLTLHKVWVPCRLHWFLFQSIIKFMKLIRDLNNKALSFKRKPGNVLFHERACSKNRGNRCWNVLSHSPPTPNELQSFYIYNCDLMRTDLSHILWTWLFRFVRCDEARRAFNYHICQAKNVKLALW